jgi:hypothetical protein
VARVMRRQFDLIELFAIAVFVGLVSWVCARAIYGSTAPAMIEEDTLGMVSAKYGPMKFSQGPEEWLIRDFFDDRKGGVFVDVGSYDARKWSNTYRLEHDLEWSGVAIDALQEFAPGYAAYRPKTKFVVAFVGESDGGSATIYVNPDEPATSSGNDAFSHLFSKTTLPREVPRRTLDGILEKAALTHVDLLSMDIELGEPIALAHFTISRYRPSLAVVEAQGQTRQAILDYFSRAGYVLVGRYLHADAQNLYFKPLPLS